MTDTISFLEHQIKIHEKVLSLYEEGKKAAFEIKLDLLKQLLTDAKASQPTITTNSSPVHSITQPADTQPEPKSNIDTREDMISHIINNSKNMAKGA